MLCLFLRLNLLCHIFGEKSENNRIFYENNKHIFQELKNRIMGEKKHNLSGPISCVAVSGIILRVYRSCRITANIYANQIA